MLKADQMTARLLQCAIDFLCGIEHRHRLFLKEGQHTHTKSHGHAMNRPVSAYHTLLGLIDTGRHAMFVVALTGQGRYFLCLCVQHIL